VLSLFNRARLIKEKYRDEVKTPQPPNILLRHNSRESLEHQQIHLLCTSGWFAGVPML